MTLQHIGYLKMTLASMTENRQIASGAGLLRLNEAAPSLRSNIPQTALVATLDTYYFF
jgi:hypothetical protein